MSSIARFGNSDLIARINAVDGISVRSDLTAEINSLRYNRQINSNSNEDLSGVFPNFKYMFKIKLETCKVNLIIT